MFDGLVLEYYRHRKGGYDEKKCKKGSDAAKIPHQGRKGKKRKGFLSAQAKAPEKQGCFF